MKCEEDFTNISLNWFFVSVRKFSCENSHHIWWLVSAPHPILHPQLELWSRKLDCLIYFGRPNFGKFISSVHIMQFFTVWKIPPLGEETLGFYLFFPDARNTNIWPTNSWPTKLQHQYAWYCRARVSSRPVESQWSPPPASWLWVLTLSVSQSRLPLVCQPITHWKLLHRELQLEHLGSPEPCMLYNFIEITTSILIERKTELLF